MVIFRPEELVNKKCGLTTQKWLDNTKMGVLKKYVFKLYLCSPAHEDLVWRKCVVAIFTLVRPHDLHPTFVTIVHFPPGFAIDCFS